MARLRDTFGNIPRHVPGILRRCDLARRPVRRHDTGRQETVCSRMRDSPVGESETTFPAVCTKIGRPGIVLRLPEGGREDIDAFPAARSRHIHGRRVAKGRAAGCQQVDGRVLPLAASPAKGSSRKGARASIPKMRGDRAGTVAAQARRRAEVVSVEPVQFPGRPRSIGAGGSRQGVPDACHGPSHPVSPGFLTLAAITSAASRSVAPARCA